ncbi:MAG: hypothetical protein OEZ01_04845 [Candidatus Heimdallarchaeota archaeon]|nr:hypothetical protein [Candidatus Heimdallarchaeota archaeon]
MGMLICFTLLITAYIPNIINIEAQQTNELTNEKTHEITPQDTYEYNDDFNNATLVNDGSNQDHTSSRIDVDFFKFILTTNRVVFFLVQSTIDLTDISTLMIYNQEQSYLFSTSFYNHSTNNGFRLGFLAGIYYIKFQIMSQSQTAYSLFVEFDNFLTEDAYEQDDSRDSATPITVNTTQSHTLTDIDWYRFEVTEISVITVTITIDSLNTKEEEIDRLLFISMVKSTTYFQPIRNDNTYTYILDSGNYLLKVENALINEIACNYSISLTINQPINLSQSSQITRTNSFLDVFSINITNPTEYIFRIIPFSNTQLNEIESQVITYSGETLYFRNQEHNNEIIRGTIIEGILFLLIQSIDYITPISYNITLITTVYTSDLYENDDIIEFATPIQQYSTQNHNTKSTTSSPDVDWYSFHLDETIAHYIMITTNYQIQEGTTPYYMNFELYDEDLNLIHSKSNIIELFYLQFNISSPGDYYIKISANTNLIIYSIKISYEVPEEINYPIDISLYFFQSNPVMFFKIQIMAEGVLNILLSIPDNINIQFINANLTTLATSQSELIIPVTADVYFIILSIADWYPEAFIYNSISISLSSIPPSDYQSIDIAQLPFQFTYFLSGLLIAIPISYKRRNYNKLIPI